jgi:deazaflavin-dependent oxidoreductase (nitroreductase family)
MLGSNPKDTVAKLVNVFHRTVFNTTKGRVLGKLGGMPVVMLTTTGRRSGAPRTTMLTTPVREEDSLVLVASYGGDDRHPTWFLNLRDDPYVEVVMEGRRRDMKARVATPEEKAELWPRVTAAYDGYAGYQKKTDRDIPLVIVEPYGD